MAANPIRIEPDGSKDLGPCDCCGDMTRRIWGYVYRDGSAEASYFVEWTTQKLSKHGAHFDLILGLWGDGTSSRDRFAVSVAFRRGAKGPEFMVIDAPGRAIAKSPLVGKALTRAEVVGTPVARRAFEIIDQIGIQDPRLAEWSTSA